MRKIILLTSLALTAACEQSPPPFISRMEAKSPDGKWIAGALTTQDFHVAPAAFHTTVYLKSLADPNTEVPVLVFPNQISKENGKIEISFRWFDGTLEVLLSRLPVFETQVRQYAGMNITVSQYFVAPAPLSAKQLDGIFHSADVKSARRLLLDLHCNATSEQVAAVRDAWHELGSTTSTEVTQDHLIQALMAHCLIAAQSPNSAPDPDIDSAVLVLRSAIQSHDIIEALVGAEGLIHHADPRDNQSIVDVAVREPKSTTFLATDLIYNCAPNAARTMQLMREQAKDQMMKNRLESVTRRAESQQNEKCDANH